MDSVAVADSIGKVCFRFLFKTDLTESHLLINLNVRALKISVLSKNDSILHNDTVPDGKGGRERVVLQYDDVRLTKEVAYPIIKSTL